MITVLIVDDEVLMREGLRVTIPWEEYGFKVIGEAESGESALEFFEKERPDVIISDIKMTDMNGLELLSKIKEIDKNTEFVIISGYGNFDYAKTAIEKQAFAYILKPFQEEELIDVLIRLEDKISARKVKNTAIESKNILGELLRESLSEKGNIEEFCKNNNIHFPKSNYMLALLQIDRGAELSNWNNISAALNEIIDYTVSLDEHYVLYSRADKASIVMIVFTSGENKDFAQVYNMLLGIKNRFCSVTEKTLTIGISGVFRNLSMLARAYRQANAALEQRVIAGNNRIIDFMQMEAGERETPIFGEEDMSIIFEGLKNGAEKEEILLPLKRYFKSLETIGKLDIEKIKSNMTELAILVLRMVAKNVHVMESIFGKVVQPVIEIQNMELLTEIENYICDIVEKALIRSDVSKIYSYSPNVRKIILYMMENYAKPITAESVAQEFYINPYHLMHIFKKETGRTFNEYLSEYRIKIAQEMLKTGKYKIYEVGYLVGYKNARHFSKKFKIITGQSPSDIKGAEEL